MREMPNLWAWAALIGIGGGVVLCVGRGAHDFICCKQADPFPLQHQHPPHDSLGMAQQEGRGEYGLLPTTPARNVLPDVGPMTAASATECQVRGGVPLWIYRQNGVTSLSCAPGNVYGDTHSTP